MNVLNGCIKKRLVKVLLFLSIFTVVSVQATEQIHTGYFNNKAVSGYDVIAYFEQAKPIEGSSKYQFKYQGADWYFSSQANLNKFKMSPEKYAPQYGGYCAWAMSNNKPAPGNPPYWTIYKAKLYLNYDQNVLEQWRANKDYFIKKADANWAGMDKE